MLDAGSRSKQLSSPAHRIFSGLHQDPRAEEIIKKGQANYFDGFKPRLNAFDARVQAKAKEGKAKLDALFGGGPAPEEKTDAAREAAERLFGNRKKE